MTSGQAMVERILTACRGASEKEVAQLAYLMARTCLSCAESADEQNLRWFEPLVGVSDLRRDLGKMSDRADVDLAGIELPRSVPASSAALDAANSCLDFGEKIEGSSTRLQFQRAQIVRAGGDLQGASDRLKFLLRDRSTAHWYCTVQESRQSALLGLGRYQDVVDIGAQLLKRFPSRRIATFNLVTALGWLGSASDFDQAAESFRIALTSASDANYWKDVILDESDWFAERLGRERMEILDSLGLPIVSRSGDREVDS
jgi:hypothetical protein